MAKQNKMSLELLFWFTLVQNYVLVLEMVRTDCKIGIT